MVLFLCVHPSRLLGDVRAKTVVESGISNGGSERVVWRDSEVTVMMS